MASTTTPGVPRSVLHGGWGIVIAVLAVLVLAGGAFAIGRTTAPGTSAPTAASVRDQDLSGTGPGAMMSWAGAHHDEITWMRSHPAQWQWMRHHPAQWQRMQLRAGQWRWLRSTTPAQWAWMRAHRGDIAWMHDHWNAWHNWRSHHDGGSGSTGSTGAGGSRRLGNWCGEGWMCH